VLYPAVRLRNLDQKNRRLFVRQFDSPTRQIAQKHRSTKNQSATPFKEKVPEYISPQVRKTMMVVHMLETGTRMCTSTQRMLCVMNDSHISLRLRDRSEEPYIGRWWFQGDGQRQRRAKNVCTRCMWKAWEGGWHHEMVKKDSADDSSPGFYCNVSSRPSNDP